MVNNVVALKSMIPGLEKLLMGLTLFITWVIGQNMNMFNLGIEVFPILSNMLRGVIDYLLTIDISKLSPEGWQLLGDLLIRLLDQLNNLVGFLGDSFFQVFKRYVVDVAIPVSCSGYS